MPIFIIGRFVLETNPRHRVLAEGLLKVLGGEKFSVYRAKHPFWQFWRALWRHRRRPLIFVMEPAQKFAPLLLLFRPFLRGRIAIDAYTSIYDTFVCDRQLVKLFSLKAVFYYLFDWLMCRAGDIMVFDTLEHQRFFERRFGIPGRVKRVVLPVSQDLEYLDKAKPQPRHYKIFPPRKFKVFFYGTYIPLQGIEYIVRAAHLLRAEADIHFVIIGAGTQTPYIEKLRARLNLPNATFIKRVPFDDLVAYLKTADLCLGIFGATSKAKRVVPNKVLDYLACRKLTITGRNPALERYFEDHKHLLYCQMADAEDLVQKIKYAKENFFRLQGLGQEGRRVVEKYFSRVSLEEKIKDIFGGD